MSYDAWLRGASARMCELDPSFAVVAGKLDVSTLPTGRTGLVIERVMLLETLREESKRLRDLTPAQQLDLEHFDACLALERFCQLEVGERLHNPGVLSGLGELLMTVLFAPYSKEEERFDRLASMLDGVDVYLAEVATTWGEPDPSWLQSASEVAEGFDDLFDAIPNAARGRASNTTGERLLRVCTKARAAVKDHHRRLRDLKPGAVVHVLGDDRYGELVKLKGYPYTITEMLEIGEEKLAHLKEQRQQAARELAFMGDFKAGLQAVRAFHPPTFDAALEEIRSIAREARDFAYERELVRPASSDDLLVIETPSFARPLIPFAAILNPRPYWPLQRSIYYVTRGESLGDVHYADLHNVVVHETYPGHHVQYAVANERGSLLRNLPWNGNGSTGLTAMGFDSIEGWAHYCEALMKRSGFHNTPGDAFAALNAAVWRAARVVIDVSVQCGRMSLDQAMQKLVDDVGLNPRQARGEVNAYLQSPGYFVSYCIGKHMIKEMRRDVERAAGRSLKDIDYHELIMSNGQAPLTLVKKRAALLAPAVGR